MESVAIFIGLAFAVNKTVSVIKAFGKDWNLVITQAVVWFVGLLALLLASNSDLTENLALPGMTTSLNDLDIPSLVLMAWVMGGNGSFAYDFLKSVDSSRSAKEPCLTKL